MSPKAVTPSHSRAISAEAKLARRSQILAAAEELVKRHGHAAISVAEVARHAGVAKGTVYLYFRSKEEIYLGLHELWLERKLDAFSQLLSDSDPTLDGARIGAAMAEVILAEPHNLVIATTCHSLMETHIELEVAFEFKLKLAGRLSRLGARIEQRFPALASGTGARLLVRAYATTLGLWQLMDTGSRWRAMENASGLEVFNADYPTELHAALVALWRGALDGTFKRKPV